MGDRPQPFAILWGVISVVLGIREAAMPLGARALVTAATLPVVALGLWATGGADSYLQAVLIFPALFIAWFFPPRMAWPLVALFLAAYASPWSTTPTRCRSRIRRAPACSRWR